MHRLLERFSSFASTAVVFVYLAGLFASTATFFVGRAFGINTDFAEVTAFGLAAAFEVHSFLSQRLTRASWQQRNKLDEALPEWDAADRQFRVHLWITIGLVTFSALNSIGFWALVLHPQTAGDWVQVFIRGCVVPLAFLAAGFLTPLTHDASAMLAAAEHAMLRKTVRTITKQAARRVETMRKAGVNLAPLGIALLENAHEDQAATRLRIIDTALAEAEGKPSVRTHAIDAPQMPTRPPTGGGTPVAASSDSDAVSATTVRTASIRLMPASRQRARGSNGSSMRGVRTASREAVARAAWVKGARTVGELERAAGVTRSTAGKYRRTFMAEEATVGEAAQ